MNITLRIVISDLLESFLVPFAEFQMFKSTVWCKMVRNETFFQDGAIQIVLCGALKDLQRVCQYF